MSCVGGPRGGGWWWQRRSVFDVVQVFAACGALAGRGVSLLPHLAVFVFFSAIKEETSRQPTTETGPRAVN